MSIFAIHAIRSNGITAASRTAHRGTILFILLLTIALPAVLLAACGGGGSDGGDGRAVSGIEATASGNNITVSWTNPEQDNITGFNINWVVNSNVANASDGGIEEFNPPRANVAVYDPTHFWTFFVFAKTGLARVV